MDDQEFEQPILVSGSGKVLHVAYDEVSVDFPVEGPIPEGAPALACRIFELFRRDLRENLQAE